LEGVYVDAIEEKYRKKRPVVKEKGILPFIAGFSE
jgi:hypothetical protein